MKRKSYILVVFTVILITVNLPAQVNSSQKTSFKIVDVDWLTTHINDPDLVIIHIAPLKLEYDREHIPGARYLFPGCGGSTNTGYYDSPPLRELRGLKWKYDTGADLVTSPLLAYGGCRYFGDGLYKLQAGLASFTLT